ncbi:hypothetical protein CSHISOI_06741 [Colletotrichum shisoi]|uniref:Uncharacterized protein n=1 Tax=Colletotrichum shisoi TaxID=2078593 RepID=A0A5Q4BP12_9PEZI|nr:hypothetical protein CSHISOI_06741 [Colletotrichum shisoi]
MIQLLRVDPSPIHRRAADVTFMTGDQVDVLLTR